MSTTNPVGSGKYKPSGVPETIVPQVAPSLSAGSIANLESKLGTILVGVGSIPLKPKVNFSLLESLSDANLIEVAKILKNMGYTVKNSRGDIKRLFQTEDVLKSIIGNKTTYPDLRDALLADFLPGQPTAEAVTLPSRTISKVNPVVLSEVINGVFEKGLKRKATKEELDALVKEYTPKLEGGTLTEVAKKKNPKTGKLESVTTITPSMNQQEAEISIEQRIKEMNPEDFDLASRIDFNSWISKNVMGA